MADDSKKILIEVDLQVKEAIANLAATKKQIADLRAEQKLLDTSTEEGRATYEAYGTAIRKLTATARDQQKTIDNTIKANNAEKDSMVQLKSNLSNLTAEYNKLSAAERQSIQGQNKAAEIKALSDQLKSVEGGL
jgi:chromosome segregation ATPase